MLKVVLSNPTTKPASRTQAAMGRSVSGSKIRAGLFTCAALICLTAVSTAADLPGATITQLFAFPCPPQQFGSCSKGYAPNVLLQASDGNFYGTAQLTTFGTSNPQGGTLFKITPSGQLTVLFTFGHNTSGNYVNGDQPATGLVEANDGLLYGATFTGGVNNSGVLFRISKTGAGFKVLHDFCSTANCADGNLPASLIMGHDGKLYGTTLLGGSSVGNCQPPFGGCGTIFRFAAPSTFTTLHELNGSTDGAGPIGIIQGSDEKFYGTSAGNVFRFTAGGQFTVLHTFLPFGILPTHASSGVFQASNGNLYGSITNYSLSQLQFYEISPSGSGFREFPSFGNRTSTSFVPSLIQASDGILWDVGPLLGGRGKLIAISPDSGSLIHSFSFSGTSGAFPDAAVVQGADGKLYGTAVLGGSVANNKVPNGTVWTLDAGLLAPAPAVAAFSPSSGTVGSRVTIRGDSFIGTTAVTFNGVSAAFTVLNAHFITTTVPAGVTSGTITLTNAGGSTVSTQQFTVP
jgi:uncharacterized repeat protein (TIGR03803 family)